MIKMTGVNGKSSRVCSVKYNKSTYIANNYSNNNEK